MKFEEITYVEDGPIGTITLNRPEDGNMFTPTMCHEIRDCINEIRRETRTRVIVLTGAGDKFFCIGGRKEGMEDTLMYAGVLPTLEMYEAIDKLQKPVIAMVNGFAVGGGNVLQVVCDITIAKESAVFRQVGPMMGSFDGGYGTWYLEDLIGKKRAKEMWYRNPKLTAREAQEWGLVNHVVPDAELMDFTRKFALEIADRGAFALASIKASFNARHGGVSGLSRMAHDLLLRGYLETDEHHELAASMCREAQARQRRSSATERRHARRSPMSHLLTLHDPSRARENYLSGVWQTDTLYSLARRHSIERGSAYAIRDGSRRLTWSALVAWVDAVAADLHGAGLRSGDRVSIWLPNRLENVVVLLACSRNGYVCNPSLHQNYTAAEVVALLSRIECRALFAQPGWGADASTSDIFASAAELGHMKRVYALPALRTIEAALPSVAHADALAGSKSARGRACAEHAPGPDRLPRLHQRYHWYAQGRDAQR